MKRLNDINIKEVTPLISPEDFKASLPLKDEGKKSIIRYREEINAILRGEDNRVLAIVGPCSIYDKESALDYGKRLKRLHDELSDKLYIIMRVYFEKPRTTIGWRGLIVDPHMDGSYQIGEGLDMARDILLEINEMGLPAGSEILDPIIPQYISELISWAAIGARTTESQTHRELTSGLSMPVGFKNSTDGSFEKAINAIRSSRHSHSFIGIDGKGLTSVLKTRGNKMGHLIMRGGDRGPNYYEEFMEDAREMMISHDIHPAIIVDCSHDNSGKKAARQERVLNNIIDQKRRGMDAIKGFMLESNINEGNQPLCSDRSELKYGVSITDECIGWETTEKLLRKAYDSL
ncbi:MAG: 3-deoxy-7-phosphoheptulonate synthase [Spirochaetales bacterium]|nr:3-deoxy-7-phosphoheptulonate synthase [Spirochaetales bacterium]